MEECTRQLGELNKGYGNLKDHLQSNSLIRLEQCRERHQQLTRQLVQVVSAIESYAIRTGAARRNFHLEAQLENKFSQLEEAARAPASARARLEELWVVLRGLHQRGAPPGGAAEISGNDADRTLQLTAAQGELIGALQEEVVWRRRDVAQFEGAVTRFAASP